MICLRRLSDIKNIKLGRILFVYPYYILLYDNYINQGVTAY